MSPSPRANASRRDAVAAARHALLEGVGVEIAASFPGITRLGGQVVAALYLADAPRSMDELTAELGRSKSNVFSNLRALEAAGIVERRREPGARFDTFALRGPYPDVVIGAYLDRLRRVVADKRELVDRATALLGDATGPDAEALRKRLGDLGRKYALFGRVFDAVVPRGGPIDLERLFGKLPRSIFSAIARVVAQALGR